MPRACVMIEESPHLRLPEALAQAWRYMSFTKFVSLIARSELYFCNLEVLAASDPHEGLLTLPNYRHREWRTVADLSPGELEEIGIQEDMSEATRIQQFESHRNS